MDHLSMELSNIPMEISIMVILNKDKKMELMDNLPIKMEINLKDNFIKINLKKVDLYPKMEVCMMVPYKMD